MKVSEQLMNIENVPLFIDFSANSVGATKWNLLNAYKNKRTSVMKQLQWNRLKILIME